MAIKEQDKVFYEELANGDKVINLPVTRANNVEGLGRSANTAYVVGDVVCVDNNKKVALKCTQAGTTSNTELDISTNNIGDTVTDGSVVWQVCNRTSDVTSVNGKTGDVVIDLPVGHMYWSVEPNVPAGRLPASGALYNRPLYQGLYNWADERGLVISESEWQAIASANDGNCAYYSDGDGSTTFRVPAIKTWTKGASSVDEVGSYLEAGLPNITGGVGSIGHGTNDFPDSGALSHLPDGGSGGYSSAGGSYKILFDASRSNSIYGNSDTVQPPSLVGMWLIVAFGVAHNIGEADVADVMSAVEQVQTGLGILEQGVGTAVDYIVESYRNGAEWYEIYKSGKVRQGGQWNQNTVTYLKPFKDTNYTLTSNMGFNVDGAGWASYCPHTKTKTSFTVRYDEGVTVRDWIAEGQGA